MKIIKQLIFLLLFFLLQISCSNLNKKNKSVETQNDRFELPQKELKGHKLKCDSTIMGLRVDFICNNKLIIEELSQHKLYSIFNLQNDSLQKISSFLEKGNGPFEVTNSFYQTTDSSIYIANYTGTINKIYKINNNNIFDKSKWITLTIPQEHKALLFPNFIMLNDSICISTGGDLLKDNILTAIDYKSGIIKGIDFKFPGFKISGNGCAANFLVYCDAQINKHPKLSKFVYTCRLGRFIEIFEMDGMNIIQKIPIYSSYPIYKASGDRRVIDNDCLMGAVTKVTKDYIYCLITPYTYKESIENKEYKGLPNYFGDNLYIFDWNGKLIDSYLLDIPVCSFCVDSSNKYIIASSIDGESFILKKYNLNMP